MPRSPLRWTAPLALSLLLAPWAASHPGPPSPAPASTPGPAPTDLEDDLDDLLEGCAELASPGVPGGVCAFGPDAFVVQVGPGGVPVIGATRAGKGRALALGHGGYASPGAFGIADTGEFVKNALQWLAGGKRKPMVSCPNADLVAAVEELGLRAQVKGDLDDVDVVVLTETSLPRARLAALREFLEGGGGVFAAATPWGWAQLNPKLTVEHDLAPNRLLVPYGLAMTRETARDTGEQGMFTEPRPGPLSHAGHAFDLLRRGALESGDAPAARARLRAALGCLPDHEPLLIVPLRRFLEGATAGEDPGVDELVTTYRARTWRSLDENWGEWFRLGPMKGNRGLGHPLSPEKELEDHALDGPGPDLGATHRGKKGSVAWEPLDAEGDGHDVDVGPVRFDAVLAAPEGVKDWTSKAVAYLYRRIETTEPRSRLLRIGADDGLRVWVNGTLVLDQPESQGVELSEADFALELGAGVNHVLVKVHNVDGPWAFRLKSSSTISQEAVNAAVDQGVAYLLERQLVDGSWPHHDKYGVGYTAYAVYCLLKSGVDADHPAIQRGLAYVRAHPCEHTYSLACKVLALSELDRGAGGRELREAVDQLLWWQSGGGAYGYPVYPGHSAESEPDLSNTLYAALALRAASKRGIQAPREAWEQLIDGTLRCREAAGGRSKRANPAAGFHYRASGSGATGSMTTAGLSILLCAREALAGEPLDKRRAREVEDAIEAGRLWLDERMTWSENPGQNNWHYFFIYGIERVGGLLDVQILGKANWYWSGAEYLVKQQKDDGSWTANSEADDTILALLFLNKATAPTSGDRRGTGQVRDAAGDVAIRGIGRNPVDVWITGYAAEVRERFGGRPDVERVRWIARDEEGVERVVAVVEPREEGASAAGQRFEFRLSFEQPGTYQVLARVTALEPSPEGAGFEPTRIELLSGAIEVVVEASERPEAITYALDHDRNLLLRDGVSIEASSHHGNQTAESGADGKHGTRWHSAIDDPEPRWSARLQPAQRANRLQLSHAWPRLLDKGKPQPAKVEVVINDELTYTLEMDADPLLKSVLTLPEAVRVARLELYIAESRARTLGRDAVGFSEVELLLED